MISDWHHITSHHITSHHTTPHHITSHHITSHHITPHHHWCLSLINLHINQVMKMYKVYEKKRHKEILSQMLHVWHMYPHVWLKFMVFHVGKDSQSHSAHLGNTSSPLPWLGLWGLSSQQGAKRCWVLRRLKHVWLGPPKNDEAPWDDLKWNRVGQVFFFGWCILFPKSVYFLGIDALFFHKSVGYRF